MKLSNLAALRWLLALSSALSYCRLTCREHISIVGAKREAKAALQELARQLKEKLPTRRTQRGYAYLLLMEYEKATDELLAEKAVEPLERAVKLRPDLIPAHVLLARVYNKLKRPEDFLREPAIIRQLTEKEPERNLGSRGIQFSAEETTAWTDGAD